MKVLKVDSYPEANKALGEDTDVAILGHNDGLYFDSSRTYCHVMTSLDNDALASKITQELGWREVSRSNGYICLFANGKRSREIIPVLEALTL